MNIKKNLLISLLLTLLIVLFSSCDNSPTIPGRKIVVSIASDYYDMELNNRLQNTINDQAAFIDQMKTLIPDSEIYMFRSERGTKWISKSIKNLSESVTPEFIFQRKIGTTTPAFYLNTTLPNSVEKVSWTSNDILTFLSKLDTTDDDIIILHYSGHGVDGTGDLVAGSIELTGNLAVTDTIDANSLINILANKKGIQMLFLDSCYSGQYVEPSVLSTADRFSQVVKDGDILDEYTYSSIFHSIDKSIDAILGSKKIGHTNFYVISGCNRNQLSYDSSSSGLPSQSYFGSFTYFLLSALGYDFNSLKGKENSKMITFYSIYNDIWNSTSPEMKSIQTPRTSLYPIDVVIAY